MELINSGSSRCFFKHKLLIGNLSAFSALDSAFSALKTLSQKNAELNAENAE